MYVKSDISRVWTSTAAQAEVRLKRAQGLMKLLVVRNLDVHYDNVQVLFHVDFEVDEGEIVALLGTNGAGKSTLIKAISGLVEATNGAVVFDGRDMTYAPPNEIADTGRDRRARRAGRVPDADRRRAPAARRLDPPQGQGPSRRGHPACTRAVPDPRRPAAGAGRRTSPADNSRCSSLGMAFIEQPRLLMIDELSLGLAPAIVEQLLPLVRDLASNGTTIVLVEQSVNLALTIAETAFFMEKGEIRFHGPTAELLERPDVLRSVFLEGAATVMQNGEPAAVAATVPVSSATIAVPVTNGANGDRPESAAPSVDRLVLDRVSKRFGGLAALSDVSFSARGGEIVGFMGPNGAGKTTLFDVISGFLPADEGAIALGEGDDQRDITHTGGGGAAPGSGSGDRFKTDDCSGR